MACTISSGLLMRALYRLRLDLHFVLLDCDVRGMFVVLGCCRILNILVLKLYLVNKFKIDGTHCRLAICLNKIKYRLVSMHP